MNRHGTMTIIAAALALVLIAGAAQAAVMPSGYLNYNPVGVTDPLRSNPANALVYDPLTDDRSGAYNFTSLGFGGSIVLTFSTAIANGAGIDLQVFETTWGSSADNWSAYRETAEVWAFNGAYAGQAAGDPGWVLLGLARQDGAFDFDGLINSTTALLLRDVSRDFGFSGGGDGYDVDGVVANYATPLPAAVWMLLASFLGVIGLRRAR